MLKAVTLKRCLDILQSLKNECLNLKKTVKRPGLKGSGEIFYHRSVKPLSL
jgi:hypothetical protein